MRRCIVVEILYAVCSVTRLHKVLTSGFCGALQVHFLLRERLLILRPLAHVVLQQHLIVVVRAVGIAIYTITYGEILLATLLAELGTERYAINTTATQAVILLALGSEYLGQVILQYGGEKYSCHNAILLGIHTFACNLIHVEDSDVEGRL